MKKILNLFIVLCLCVSLFACSSSETKTSDKTKVRVALCQQVLLGGLPEALMKKFPDVEFEFLLSNNSAKYYTYLAKHDDLPDIITVRRFSLRDSLELKDYLVDLSTSEIASSYYQNFLNNYTFSDGTINWLPTTAEVWCIVANKTLFEENNIEIPTDYESFIDACEKFEALGIKGYTTDWEYDYSCLETLEGFNIETLQSQEGKKWRTDYESGLTTTTTTDDNIWASMFEKMEEVLTKTNNLGEDVALQEFADVQSMMDNREVAMIRSSASEIIGYGERNDDEFVLLPYFGEENNWLLTYPNFQAAMSSKSDVDSKLLEEIYNYILGQVCQDALDMGSNAISYNKNVTVTMNDYLKELEGLIDSNYIFIRLANDAFFSASKTAVQGMINGEYGASDALDVFNEALEELDSEVTYDLNVDTGYEYTFGENGSEASSAVLNSCRSLWGTDLAVIYSESISNSVYAGPTSSSEVKYWLATNYAAPYYLELTGEEVFNLVSGMFSIDAIYKPLNDSMLPVSSGFEMNVSKNDDGSYTLNSITINGEEVDKSTTYTIIFAVPSAFAKNVASASGIELPDGSNKIVDGMTKTLTNYLSENSSLVKPSKYITLN